MRVRTGRDCENIFAVVFEGVGVVDINKDSIEINICVTDKVDYLARGARTNDVIGLLKADQSKCDDRAPVNANRTRPVGDLGFR